MEYLGNHSQSNLIRSLHKLKGNFSTKYIDKVSRMVNVLARVLSYNYRSIQIKMKEKHTMVTTDLHRSGS